MTGAGALTITDFILDRIAEDEALLATPMARRMVGRRIVDEPIKRLPEYVVRDRERWAAECKAKRAIVGAHQSYVMAEGEVCENCRGEEKDEWFREPWPCATVRHLAAVYASHPDYDPAWAPES